MYTVRNPPLTEIVCCEESISLLTKIIRVLLIFLGVEHPKGKYRALNINSFSVENVITFDCRKFHTWTSI